MISGGGIVKANKKDDLLEGLVLELRRGTIILSVLSQLNCAHYGYSLVLMLEKKGINIEAGTLYPLLRRLEKQGLLESSWEMESAKPRKYYKLSEYGRYIYKKLCEQWFVMTRHMDALIKGEE